jgi:hypothetical protein
LWRKEQWWQLGEKQNKAKAKQKQPPEAEEAIP